ncbi:MAG: hypothetical protein AAGH53_05385 [Pseudomonadota bacterium]
MMTPDSAFYTFSSISLAATMLAFVIGFRDVSIKDGVRLVYALMPQAWGAKRELQREQVQRKTRIADEAMAAKERGERFVPPSDYHGC